VAIISLLGIIIESIRRKRGRSKKFSHDSYFGGVTEDTNDDGIIGEVRIIKTPDIDVKQSQDFNSISRAQSELKSDKNQSLLNIDNSKAPELIIFYLKPQKNRRLSGQDLKHCLSQLGFEYNSMKIFDYQESQNNEYPLKFSIVSAFEPGTFDLEKMSHQNFNGLCCFLDANPYIDASVVDKMLAIIDKIAAQLPIEVYDSKHKLCNMSYIRQCKQRISK